MTPDASGVDVWIGMVAQTADDRVEVRDTRGHSGSGPSEVLLESRTDGETEWVETHRLYHDGAGVCVA